MEVFSREDLREFFSHMILLVRDHATHVLSPLTEDPDQV